MGGAVFRMFMLLFYGTATIGLIILSCLNESTLTNTQLVGWSLFCFVNLGLMWIARNGEEDYEKQVRRGNFWKKEYDRLVSEVQQWQN